MDNIKKTDEKNFSLDELIKLDKSKKKPVKKPMGGVHAKRKTLSMKPHKKMAPKQHGKGQPKDLKARRQPIHKDKHLPHQSSKKHGFPPKGGANQSRGQK